MQKQPPNKMQGFWGPQTLLKKIDRLVVQFVPQFDFDDDDDDDDDDEDDEDADDVWCHHMPPNFETWIRIGCMHKMID